MKIPADLQRKVEHLLIGIVGKTNVGKSTFFSAATMVKVGIEDRPFVTIKANEGVGYVRVKSVCSEFGLRCNPRHGWCTGTHRFVPVRLLDVAGLVPGAHDGRGLGNRFLDDLRRSSVNIVVVDASGATDSEGRRVRPGTHDPLEDVSIVKEEFAFWMVDVLRRNLDKFYRRIFSGENPERILSEILSGLEIRESDIRSCLSELEMDPKRLVVEKREEDIFEFVRLLIRKAKPFVIAANKVDVPEAEDNLRRMRESIEDPIIPVSAEAELILKKAAKMGLIHYEPGSSDFYIIDERRLKGDQRKVLEIIRERVLKKYGSTGIQKALECAVFDVGRNIAVFPVENETKLCDKDGKVLPDVFILPAGSTVLDLAKEIHSEIAERAVCGIDVRTRNRVSINQRLRHRDIIKIVTGRG